MNKPLRQLLLDFDMMRKDNGDRYEAVNQGQ